MTDATLLGPLALREFDLPAACQESHGHAHNYDHVTFVQAGAIRVYYRRPGEDHEHESIVFRAGEFALILANVEHRIKALEPGTKYACVFPHRDADGLVVQEYQGHDEAYV